jgi:hypothetical protein
MKQPQTRGAALDIHFSTRATLAREKEALHSDGSEYLLLLCQTKQQEKKVFFLDVTFFGTRTRTPVFGLSTASRQSHAKRVAVADPTPSCFTETKLCQQAND